MIKLVVMIKRKPGMPKEDFHRYWSGPHAEQVLGCADFKRHPPTICTMACSDPEGNKTSLGGIRVRRASGVVL